MKTWSLTIKLLLKLTKLKSWLILARKIRMRKFLQAPLLLNRLVLHSCLRCRPSQFLKPIKLSSTPSLWLIWWKLMWDWCRSNLRTASALLQIKWNHWRQNSLTMINKLRKSKLASSKKIRPKNRKIRKICTCSKTCKSLSLCNSNQCFNSFLKPIWISRKLKLRRYRLRRTRRRQKLMLIRLRKLSTERLKKWTRQLNHNKRLQKIIQEKLHRIAWIWAKKWNKHACIDRKPLTRVAPTMMWTLTMNLYSKLR